MVSLLPANGARRPLPMGSERLPRRPGCQHVSPLRDYQGSQEEMSGWRIKHSMAAVVYYHSFLHYYSLLSLCKTNMNEIQHGLPGMPQLVYITGCYWTEINREIVKTEKIKKIVEHGTQIQYNGTNFKSQTCLQSLNMAYQPFNNKQYCLPTAESRGVPMSNEENLEVLVMLATFTYHTPTYT